ncbi:hypothetical protein, variant [Saprolegnia diclina VS20]|uniref:TNFR-Cys domain-containing protein n=1 Tax=Saprolegnia diclina (strain VS20) TaxID=1156394 RepID=T0RZY7_SAPDV|nr:hypothetical protein, variant [Saprolegnia diclina VS20]EQC38143.1 hypothetical protein, variant [Saprolegnia diclina VS20]|eukprot:XP_008608470.1 hypothetical protein, variant [Saprolegnia diclina VS20]
MTTAMARTPRTTLATTARPRRRGPSSAHRSAAKSTRKKVVVAKAAVYHLDRLVKCVDAEHVRQKTAKCTVCGVCRFCPAGADECAANHRVLRPMTNKTRAPRAKVLLCENEEHHHKKTHRGKCVRCLKCKWCPPVIDECKEFHVDPETSMTPTKVKHTVKLESILSILDIAKGKLVQVKPRDIASSTPKRRLACELMTHVVHSVAHLLVEPNRKKPDVTIEGLSTLLDDLRRDLRGHPPAMEHFVGSRHSSGSSSASSETSQVMSIIL